MSSRLILLPKKSYTPWNTANVARVERDEAEANLKKHQQAQEERQRQSQWRIQTLRDQLHNNKSNQHDDNDDIGHPKHVNLFELEEEQAMKEACYSHKVSSKEEDDKYKQIEFLAASELRRRRHRLDLDEKNKINSVRNDDADVNRLHSDALFYGGKFMNDDRNYGKKKRIASSGRLDQMLKEKMDPMAQFYTCTNTSSKKKQHPKQKQKEVGIIGSSYDDINNDCDNVQKKAHMVDDDYSDGTIKHNDKKRKHKQKANKKYSKKKSKSHQRLSDSKQKPSKFNSVAKMRQKRVEREEQERKREESIINQEKLPKHLTERISWRYSDHYNPGLSRR